MPVVPEYPVGAVQQRVAQTPQAGADSFGAVQGAEIGQIGQATLQGGEGMLNDATQYQEFANRAQLRDTLSQAQNDTMDYITDNVLAKKGKDAVGLMPQVQTGLKGIQAKYSDALTNPAQQRMFNQLYPAVFNRATNLVRRHILQQTLDYNQQTLVASKGAAVNEALTDYKNPQNITDAETTIAADNNSIYAGSPDAGKIATQNEISKLHSDIATTMSDTDPAGAAVYLRQNQGKILPQDYAKLSNSVDTKILTDDANKTASTLSALDPATALAEANKIDDPQKRQLTIDALQTHFATQNAAASLSAANDDANNAATVLGNPTQAAMVLPKDLPPDQRAQLVSAANDRIQATQNGKPIQTNLDVYGSLVNQAAHDPDGFLRRPLTPYLSQLSDDDWKSVMDLRDGLAKRRDATVDKAYNLDSVNKVFSDSIKGFPELSTDGPDGKPLPPGPALQQKMQDINAFRRDFSNRMNTQFPDPANRTPDNAQEVLNKMLSRVVVQKGWFGFGNKTALQGQVDENPSLKWWTHGTPLTPGQYQGQPAYYDYNSDRTSADVYDSDGKKLGTWPPQK